MRLKCSSLDLFSEKLLCCVTSEMERSSADHVVLSDDTTKAGHTFWAV